MLGTTHLYLSKDVWYFYIVDFTRGAVIRVLYKVFKKTWFKAFITAYILFMISCIPVLIMGHGMFIYYGDFNVQQIPFYMHVHEAIKSGRLLYDWSTDLGGSFLGCYSFYLTGSPFFWLTIPFKTSFIPYLMPWIIALKYAVMAATASVYAGKHLKTETGAYVAALLYAFSGFQGAVLVYNHFHDVMAFFPLYLLLFERAMESKKRLGFTLMTAFMAIINYYFFVGEVVFLALYFVAKYVMGEGKAREKLCMLLRAMWCGATGVLLAAVYLIPAVYYTLGNSRISDVVLGYDLIAYKEPAMFMGIIKNIVMLPDVSGHNSMYNFSMSRVSGVGGYLPLFSIAGVIAYFLYNKGKDWMKRLTIMCLVCAFVPVLNALFSALNSEYYARWFYMPILIMAVMSAKMVESAEVRVETEGFLKKGIVITGVITATIAVTALLPAKTEAGELTILGALKNPEQLICQTIFSVVFIICFFLYILFLAKNDDFHLKSAVWVSCLAVTATMLLTGALLVPGERRDSVRSQVLKGESPFEACEGFYRIETEEDVYNYPMYWDEHTITSFISTIPSSTLDFYNGLGIRRKVTSHLATDKVGTRALLSTKYFVKENEPAVEVIGRVEDMEKYTSVGYEEAWTKNGFTIYENAYFIPMGFSFADYITETEFEELDCSKASKDKMLVRVAILSDEVATKLDGVMNHASVALYDATSTRDYYKACDARRASACDEFTESTYGFKAHKISDGDEFVFFSIPYEDGFTAYVDGVETSIYKVDFGMMGIVVPDGEHDIEFKYALSGIDIGKKITILGILSLIIEIAVVILDSRKKEN